MVKKFIGQSIMSKKINVFELSEGLDDVIIKAIASHLRPVIYQFINENNCFEERFNPDGLRVSVVCYVRFAELRIPTDFFDSYDLTKGSLKIKNFRADPFVDGADCFIGYLPYAKKEILDKATKSVAKQVYLFITNKY